MSSPVRKPSASSPRLAAVSVTVAIVANAAAPHSERNPPLTLRCTTDLRNARSQALLSGDTSARYRKVSNASRCLRWRFCNRRRPTFYCDDDYEAYLDLMAEWCAELEVQVWAYCLMPNHVHLIAVPASADGLRRGQPTGRPAGSEAFVALLEGLTGRRLERQKPGPTRAEGS